MYSLISIKFVQFSIRLTLVGNLIFVPNSVLCQIKNQPNPGSIYEYNRSEISQQKTEQGWYHKYWNGLISNPYNQYLKDLQKELTRCASVSAKTTFDNLFDNRVAPRRWYTFNDLNKSLTNTRLSESVIINLNWNDLYQQSRHEEQNLDSYDYSLLRFYNIIAKLYSIPTVLHLVQKTKIDNNATLFAHTDYFLGSSAIQIRFSSEFANQTMINQQYKKHGISTNIPIDIVVREYAHTLFYYIANTEKQRENFNTYPITSKKIDESDQINKQISQMPSNTRIFHDLTQSLIDFIASKSEIDINNDPIKKMLMTFFVVNSKVSKKAWIVNNVNARDELFAEAFARWLGTPDLDRDFSWEILNEYFMSVFKKDYNL